jgi:hypothetical protein
MNGKLIHTRAAGDVQNEEETAEELLHLLAYPELPANV